MKITIPGLSAIACAVVLLWACLFGERITMHKALEQRANVIRTMEHSRRTTMPTVSAPQAGSHGRRHPIYT